MEKAGTYVHYGKLIHILTNSCTAENFFVGQKTLILLLPGQPSYLCITQVLKVAYYRLYICMSLKQDKMINILPTRASDEKDKKSSQGKNFWVYVRIYGIIISDFAIPLIRGSTNQLYSTWLISMHVRLV